MCENFPSVQVRIEITDGKSSGNWDAVPRTLFGKQYWQTPLLKNLVLLKQVKNNSSNIIQANLREEILDS